MKRFAAVALLPAACIGDGDEGVIDVSGKDGKADSPNRCDSIGPYAQFFLDELAAIWGNEPSYVCGYVRTRYRTGCGQVLPQNAGYCPADGSISMDTTFLASQAEQFGDFAPAVVLAHEWGHMNQQAVGFYDGNRTAKEKELHADCQAGVFIAAHQLARGAFDVGPIAEGFSSLCSQADPDWTWWDPEKHGTCAQRLSAFATGYDGGRGNPAALSARPLETMLAICGH